MKNERDKRQVPYMMCPKCRYKFDTDLYRLRSMDIDVAIGDALDLKQFREERADGSHYYSQMLGTKVGKIAVLEAILKVKKRGRRRNE